MSDSPLMSPHSSTACFKSITSISGDIGAFNYQPGLECLKKNEIMYVSSGLGEKKDNDLIGIINNKLYKTKI